MTSALQGKNCQYIYHNSNNDNNNNNNTHARTHSNTYVQTNTISKQTQTQTQTETDTDTDRDRQRQTQTETDTDTDRDTERTDLSPSRGQHVGRDGGGGQTSGPVPATHATRVLDLAPETPPVTHRLTLLHCPFFFLLFLLREAGGFF